MAIGVKHKFQSQLADGTDASVVRPSNWNDSHEITMQGPAIIGRTAQSPGEAVEVPLHLNGAPEEGEIPLYGPDGRLVVGTPDADDHAVTRAFLMEMLDGLEMIPAGIMTPLSGNTIPPNWLRANGQTVNRITYARLWTFVQTSGNLAASEGAKTHGQYGPGNGTTTFTLPNLEADGGYFIRPVSSGRGTGTIQGDLFGSHSHSGSAGGGGNHTHFVLSNQSFGDGAVDPTPDTVIALTASIGGNAAYRMRRGTVEASLARVSYSGNHTHSISTNAVGGAETRPKNIGYPVIIKT